MENGGERGVQRNFLGSVSLAIILHVICASGLGLLRMVALRYTLRPNRSGLAVTRRVDSQAGLNRADLTVTRRVNL
jgi:hypothetical protein